MTALARAPCSPSTTTGGVTGRGFACTQAASALMSIGRKTGGVPSNFTVPAIEPAVTESTTAVGSDGCASRGFLLHPSNTESEKRKQADGAKRIFKRSFLAPHSILSEQRI